MNPALLLIDLQNDYLGSGGLEPSAGPLCAAAARLLEACREADVPVLHIWTTIRHDDERMPHWQAAGRRLCAEGTVGHATPMALAPREGECIIHKQFYSAFTNPEAESLLRKSRVDTVLLAGVYLRGCVRATALDAYQRRLEVLIADEAVADDDPVHAVVTRQYLDQRVARFVSVARLCLAVRKVRPASDVSSTNKPRRLPAMVLRSSPSTRPGLDEVDHGSPAKRHEVLWRVPVCGAEEVREAAAASRLAAREWERVPRERCAEMLLEVAARVAADAETLARQIAVETGKPLRDARQEVTFAVALLRAAVRAATSGEGGGHGPGWQLRRRPHGVVAIITPWNNPLAIPLGKIAPALLNGNTVVWKPALPGASVALTALEILFACGVPAGTVNLVQGNGSTGERLMSDASVAAVTLTGSSAAGYAAQVLCAARRLPFQGELGGNNAAIVWSDADLTDAARQVAKGAFRCAGQRCTANRRVIIDRECLSPFLEAVHEATAALQWGDPLDDVTDVGPVVSAAAFQRIADVVDRARSAGSRVICPHADSAQATEAVQRGWYYPPTIVCCDDPAAEIVREETFGPVLVVQPADNWTSALSLCDGVPQGLVASLFSRSAALQQDFLNGIRAGLLKINSSTAGAAGDAPFGGWKASGVGPPEHGAADIEFYTRSQTVYLSDAPPAEEAR